MVGPAHEEGSLLESVPGLTVPPLAAILVADDDGRFCEVNIAATRLLQYSESQLLAMHIWDITAPSQRSDARALWREFIKAGSQAGTYQVRRADGRRVTVHYEAVANFRPERHLSVMRPLSEALAESRPLDECPYERPFGVDFDRCPAYQPLLTYMADSNEHAVRPVWTCEHLAATQIPGEARYYGRCGLGDALDRSRWLTAAAELHFLPIRRLRIRFYAEALEPVRELMAARTADLSEGSRGERHQRVALGIAGVLAAFDAFSDKNAPEFAAAGVDVARLRSCLQATLDLFRRQWNADSLRPPADLVSQYPVTVRAFMRPDLVAADLLKTPSGVA